MIDISPLWVSLKIALIATIFTFFLGLATAYWMFNYQGKWKSIIEGILISPLVLPPTVVGFLLLVLLGKNGFIGKLLFAWNLNLVFTWYGAVIAATVVSFPLMYKTALGAFEQSDRNLLRVARTLGASESRIFWRITLPLALPGIIAGTTLAFTRALGEFGATLMIAGNIPGETQTIPMSIYFAVEAGAMKEAGLWALVIIGISLSAIIITHLWRFRKARLSIDTLNFIPATLGNIPPYGLFVDIQKQLPSFTLRVAFSANNSFGLLGASGAGKSMILRCIAGIESPDKGRIILNRRVLFDSEKRINLPPRDRRIGLLVQNYALFPHLTVAENITFGLSTKTSITKKQQVETQLATVQLQDFANRYPHELSGGQQQRVALARALASQPEVLLLDEPFSALDTHLRSQIEKQLIATLSTYSGVTLFVTHNVEEAYRICQDLLVIEAGARIASGTKHEIFKHPNTVSVAQLTGCKNFSRAISRSSQVEALDWGCMLKVIEPIPKNLSHIGIRAHQITFTNDKNLENTFPCWLVQASETPHRMTLYLKINATPEHLEDYHLQAEVFKEKWEIIKERSLPWYVTLDPLRLILLS